MNTSSRYCRKLLNLRGRHAFIRSIRGVKTEQKLRRSLLYVPGDDERKISKIQTLTVDSVILDCEDGVAQNRKQRARENIRKVLDEVPLSANIDWGVRVNAVCSEHFRQDLDVLFNGENTPQTIYLPKVNQTSDLDEFKEALFKSMVPSLTKSRLPELFIYAESCLSVMDLPKLCRHATTISEKDSAPLFQLTGIVFGSDDFCASLGATRSKFSNEILYARQRIVLVAKAFGLQAVDMVDINLNDLDALQQLSEEGVRLGYTGKQVIHPKQVEIVQKAFTPSEALEKWACELLDAFDKHQMNGKGAFIFQNQMIDAPTMKQAQNIVEFMKRTKK